MSNRGLATQEVTPATMHWKRVDIDWIQPDLYRAQEMVSWRNVRCYCKTPWRHW